MKTGWCRVVEVKRLQVAERREREGGNGGRLGRTGQDRSEEGRAEQICREGAGGGGAKQGATVRQIGNEAGAT